MFIVRTATVTADAQRVTLVPGLGFARVNPQKIYTLLRFR